jgi:flagellar hook assembly protein FlgD
MAVAAKDSKMLGVIDGSGKVTITDANVTKLVLKLTEGLAVPKVFALSQNYPNPFNPTTHFSVDVPRAAAVDITVYDVLGRKIVTLMSGEQEAGYHVMEWDSKDGHGMTVPSGMYMVRMTAGDFSAVRKIMLMK